MKKSIKTGERSTNLFIRFNLETFKIGILNWQNCAAN